MIRYGFAASRARVPLGFRFLAAGLLVCQFAAIAHAGASWWDASWPCRRRLTFDNSGQTTYDLNDFPVLVKLTTSNFDFDAAMPNGEDVRFVDADDATPLKHEIERWDAAGRNAAIWVKVPLIPAGAGANYIWMYYGKTGETDAQDPTNVWDGAFAMVHHLSETSGPHVDSTSNPNDGTVTGASQGTATGQVAGADDFDGTSDYVDVGSHASIDDLFAGGGTVSVWINPRTWGANEYGRIIDKGSDVALTTGWGLFVNNSGVYPTVRTISFGAGFDGVIAFWAGPTDSLALNTWQHVAVVYDDGAEANDPVFYVNGTAVATVDHKIAAGTYVPALDAEVRIGCNQSTTEREFDGTIDEVRLSNIIRDPDWIRASYLTQAQVSFPSYGSEQLYLDVDAGGILDETFDGEAGVGLPTDWRAWGTPDVSVVRDGGVAIDEDEYLSITRSGANEGAWVPFGPSSSGTTVVEWLVRKTNGDIGGFSIANSAGDVRARVRFSGSGTIQYYNGSSWTDTVPATGYVTDTWYRMRLEIDEGTDLYDIYVDNVLMQENIDTENNAAAPVEIAALLCIVAGTDGNTMYVDDVEVYTHKKWIGGASADWGTDANWAPFGVPIDADEVRFTDQSLTSYQPDLDTDRTVAAVIIDDRDFGPNDTDVDIGAHTLTISGDLDVAFGGTLDVGAGTVVVSGDARVEGQVTVSTGVVDADGAWDGTGATVSFTGDGALLLGGDVTAVADSLTSTAGAVVYDGSADQTIDAGVTYHDLTIDNTGAAVATQGSTADLDVNGDLLVNDADAALASSAGWWNPAYGFRRRIAFGTTHAALPRGYTVGLPVDTRPSATNVALATGDDVRVVWQPRARAAVELDRIGDVWDDAGTVVEFRLQSDVGANRDEDVDGAYFVYYGNGTPGTPPADEMNVYYFADFFDRGDSPTIANGWSQWTTGGGSVAIASGSLTVSGDNALPPDAGIKRSFSLGPIPGDFTITFDWTMSQNVESSWTHYLNVGNAAVMSDGDRTAGVGPGIYTGMGAHFVPNAVENVSNDLSGNMETDVYGGPYAIKMVVDLSAHTYDYYRDDMVTPKATAQTFVNAEDALDQIRIACDEYLDTSTAFAYDNVKIVLRVATAPSPATGAEQAVATGGTITVAGDWTNNGTFTHNGGTVVLDGAGPQAVSAPAGLTLHDLAVANTGGAATPVSLALGAGGQLVVAGDLHLDLPITLTMVDADCQLVVNGTVSADQFDVTAANPVTFTTSSATTYARYAFGALSDGIGNVGTPNHLAFENLGGPHGLTVDVPSAITWTDTVFDNASGTKTGDGFHYLRKTGDGTLTLDDVTFTDDVAGTAGDGSYDAADDPGTISAADGAANPDVDVLSFGGAIGGPVSDEEDAGANVQWPGGAPLISTMVANDPDDADNEYGVGDTITITFSVSTDLPTEVVLDDAPASTMDTYFTLTGGSWGDSGDTYDVGWTSSTVLVVTVVSESSASIVVGTTTLALTTAASVFDSTGTYGPSTDTSPPLAGDWGDVAPPSLDDVAADDADDLDDMRGAGDTITLEFDRDTNESVSGAKTGLEMDALFSLSGGHSFGGTSDSYALSWPDPRTLVVTVVSMASATVDVGDTLTVLAAADIQTLGGSAPSTASFAIGGDWGTTPPDRLVFTVQPQTTQVGQTMPALAVEVRYPSGAPATAYATAIDLTIGTDPAGGSALGGTVSVVPVNGVATFDTLTIDQWGYGFTLVATSGALTATSDAFDIMPPPPTVTTATATPNTADQYATITFDVTVQDGSPPVNVTVDFDDGSLPYSEAVDTTTGSASISVDHLFSGAGSFDVTVTVNDLHDRGDPGGATTIPVTISADATAPTLTITDPTDGTTTYETYEETLNIIGTADEPLTQIRVTLPGPASEYFDITPAEADWFVSVLINVGPQVLYIAGQDRAGNWSVDVPFNVDRIDSDITVTITQPASSDVVYNTPVQFEATVSGGVPGYTYEWDFGDGNTSSSVSPTHTYLTLGYQLLSLTVTDSASTIGRETVVLSLNVVPPALVPSVSFSPTSPAAGQRVVFDGTLSTGDVEWFFWDWDYDGETPAFDEFSQGGLVTHVFPTTGWAQVAVQLEDVHGQTEQLVLNVPVSANSDEAVLEVSPAAITLSGRPGIDRSTSRTLTVTNAGEPYTVAAVIADASALPAYVSVSPLTVSVPGGTSATVTVTLDAASAPEGVTTALTETLTFDVIASPQSADVAVTVDLRPYGDGGCAAGAHGSGAAGAPAWLGICVIALARRRRRAGVPDLPFVHDTVAGYVPVRSPTQARGSQSRDRA